METATFVRKGLEFTIEKRPKKNAYVRTRVRVVDARNRTAFSAWDDAVDVVIGIFGSSPTEDGTVGQAVQCNRAFGLDTCYTLSCNLYNRKIRDIHKRIDAAVAGTNGE